MKQDLFTLIRQTSQALQKAKNVSQPDSEAWWLLEALTGKNRSGLLASRTHSFTKKQTELLGSWIDRRVLHKEPLQYLIGTTPFCGLNIGLEKPILIPRQETEEWCSRLLFELKHVERPLKILDLCTGTGCISLALASTLKNSDVTGVDISSQAIKLSEKNKKNLNVPNVNFVKSDLYKELSDQTFDIVISNPPYLSEPEWEKLEEGVRLWEDKGALVGKNNGLDFYKTIIDGAAKHLAPRPEKFEVRQPPRLVFEIGERQVDALREFLTAAGYSKITFWKDSFGKARVVLAY